MTAQVIVALDAIRDAMPLPEGVTADDSGALPAKYVANRLYAWPDIALPQKLEERNGRWPEADLRVRMLLALPNLAEQRGANTTRRRDVTVELADWLEAAHAAVVSHSRHDLWWDAYIEAVKFDAVRSIEVRGVGIIVVLRLNPGAEVSPS